MLAFKDEMKKCYYYRPPCYVLSVSYIALDVCRQLHYPMWKNRDEMTRLIKEWWDALPKSKDESFYRILFNRNCLLTCHSGATFISLYPNQHTKINGMSLICFS
jgi:hypothetical protein